MTKPHIDKSNYPIGNNFYRLPAAISNDKISFGILRYYYFKVKLFLGLPKILSCKCLRKTCHFAVNLSFQGLLTELCTLIIQNMFYSFPNLMTKTRQSAMYIIGCFLQLNTLFC